MPSSFKHVVPVLTYGQDKLTNCWYASYKMLFKFHSRPEASIEEKIKGAGVDFQDAYDNGLKDTDYKKCAAALTLTSWAGSAFNQEPEWYDIGLSDGAEAFLTELQKGPMWVSRISGSNYHAVLATGYNDSKSHIIYNNPHPGPDHAIEVDLMKANTFVRYISGAAGSVQAYRP